MNLKTVVMADLAAAAPSIFKLDFTTVGGLLVIYARGGIIVPSQHFDLTDDPRKVARAIARYVTGNEIDSAYLVLVAETGIPFGVTGVESPFTAGLSLHRSALDQLSGIGIRVRGQIHVEQISRGARWRDLTTSFAGTLPDPETSAAALAGILGSVTPLVDLGFIRAHFAPDPDPVDPITAELEARTDPEAFAVVTLRELSRRVGAYATTNPDEREEMLAALVDARGTTVPLSARLAYLLRISDPAHAAMLGISLIDPAAATVYTEIANQLTGIDRAHVLTAVAIVHYANENGAHAHEALRFADLAVSEARTERPPLLRMMWEAYAVGIESDQAKFLLYTGKSTAEQFGIDLYV
ncbi:DUF4192 domain-containing protein (plasmid) [Nocardia sp. NBC_01377]|uniref:DUF4192 family protein n=1 Tax=Nocardia sp. NBC_01377 TaxID=2903595 RepID=UPI002F90B105